MLMFVYRHYSKGSDRHAEREKGRKEKEREVFGEKHWKGETEREKESPCALSDRQQQGLWCLRHTIPYHHLLLNCLPPPHTHTFPRASGEEHSTSHLSTHAVLCSKSNQSLFHEIQSI